MEIKIFDVAHGFCAAMMTDEGHVWLFDCGNNPASGFQPRDFLIDSGCNVVNRFFVLNFDEDHLSGLPGLTASAVTIDTVHVNTSITADQLQALKEEAGPLGPGMRSLLPLMRGLGLSAPPVAYRNIRYGVFRNSYPTVRDTNNLSLVVFVHGPGIDVVFPGDLEVAGWEALLANPEFRDELSTVEIFVASHHGRINGYCPRVFDHCVPDIVIISDQQITYQSQEVDYARHARGILWNQTDHRRVLTTRNDGTLSITSQQHGGCYIKAG